MSGYGIEHSYRTLTRSVWALPVSPYRQWSALPFQDWPWAQGLRGNACLASSKHQRTVTFQRWNFLWKYTQWTFNMCYQTYIISDLLWMTISDTVLYCKIKDVSNIKAKIINKPKYHMFLRENIVLFFDTSNMYLAGKLIHAEIKPN